MGTSLGWGRAVVCLVVVSAGCGDSGTPFDDDAGNATHDAGSAPDAAAPRDSAVTFDARPVDSGWLGDAPADAAPRDATAPGDGWSSGLPGDDCASAARITAGELASQTTRGYAPDYVAGGALRCPAGAGPGRLYRIDVPTGQRLTAAFDVTGGGVRPALGLFVGGDEACAAIPRTCLGSASGRNPDATRLRHVNLTAETETAWLYVVDDAADGAGFDFTLTTALDTAPEGDRCDDAIAIVPGVRHDSLVGFTSDLSGGVSCVSNGGPDRVYTIDVPAGQYLTAALLPTTEIPTISISLVTGTTASCSGSLRRCAASEDTSDPGAITTVRYHNTSSDAEHVFIVLDTQSEAMVATLPFTLTTTLGGPPPGDFCENAELITPGTLTGQTTLDYDADYGGGTGCPGFAGRDRVYMIDVPAGMRLVARADLAGSGVAPDVRILDGVAARCHDTPLACFDATGMTTPAGRRYARYVNAGSETRRVFIMVDSQLAGSGNDFSLFTALYVAVPAPAGDTCASAENVASGSYPGTTVGYADDVDQAGAPGCAATSGLDRVYRVHVPTGHRLNAHVRPVDGATLSLLAGAAACVPGALRCVASSTSGAGDVTYLNYDGPPADLLLLVDRGDPSDLGRPFTLDVETVSVFPGDICSLAEEAAPPFERLAQSTEGYQDDYRTGIGCDALPGPDRVYHVVIPAGTTMRAVATPAPTSDVRLSLVVGDEAACAATLRICSTSSSAAGMGEPETMLYSNTGSEPRSAYLTVDDASAATYDLRITLE